MGFYSRALILKIAVGQRNAHLVRTAVWNFHVVRKQEWGVRKLIKAVRVFKPLTAVI